MEGAGASVPCLGVVIRDIDISKRVLLIRKLKLYQKLESSRVTIGNMFPQNHFPLSHAESCPGFIFSSLITTIVNDTKTFYH